MKPSELFKEMTKNNGLYNIQAIDIIHSIMKKGFLSYERAKGTYIHSDEGCIAAKKQCMHPKRDDASQVCQLIFLIMESHVIFEKK